MSKISLKVDKFDHALNHAAHEEEVLNYWDDVHAFKRSVQERPADNSYIFYDGPPFATGLPHYGHLLASTVKDVVPRYWTMRGYRVERTWGWDCHGVPIENMIEGELGLKGGKKGIEALGIDKFNTACRSSILRYDKEWQITIRRLGRWVDFEHSYKTMDKPFMESVWWAFKTLYNKDLVYQGRKVVLYCPRCSTPLSNFEIAMDNSYKDVASHSLYVKFRLKDTQDEYFVAWTTTPWTLPGNVGLAVKSDATYVQVEHGHEKLWFAQNLAPKGLKVLKNLKGRMLVGLTYEPLFNFLPIADSKAYQICSADFVSLEDGTGIVHTAAIYGEDDYQLALQEGLPTIPMLDDQGKFLDFVTPLSGQFYAKTQDWIIHDLMKNGLIFKSETTTHSYPFCYRCGTALYYNAIPAWFINIQKLKPALLKQNQSISWYPSFLKNGRFGKGLETAPDWNISRSRYWGTPMPIWVGEKTGKIRVIGSIDELTRWAVTPLEHELTDIHREFIDQIDLYVDDEKTEIGHRISDVFDCWIESGSMPFAEKHYPFKNKQAFENRYPAQFITEYIAQTRAWFYTLHVLSVAIFGKPAFQNALTTGTILAEDGTKMSKSKKNYPDPTLLINKYGVDSLRLYLMSSSLMRADNLSFAQASVDEIRKNVMNIWWNIFAFCTSSAIAPEKCLQTQSSLGDDKILQSEHPLDRWLLSKIEGLTQTVTKSMDNYDILGAVRPLMAFAKEFSTWYLRLSRDRLRTSTDSQAVLEFALRRYCLLMAPFAPFMSERIYQNLPNALDSIHLELWPVALESRIDLSLEQQMVIIQEIVEKGHAQRKLAGIRLRQPLPLLTTPGVISPDLQEIIKHELNVKSILTGPFSLDTNLTPELEAEGIARDLMRDIQGERKKLRLSPKDAVVVTLPSWPASWEDEIKKKVGAKSLSVGPTLTVNKL